MTINDRFTRGWIAGALGSILGSIWSFLAYQVGFTTLRLSDWSAILIYGRIPPFSLADEVWIVNSKLDNFFKGLIAKLNWG